MTELWTCNICGKEKTIDLFVSYVKSAHSCKVCMAARQANYYIKVKARHKRAINPKILRVQKIEKRLEEDFCKAERDRDRPQMKRIKVKYMKVAFKLTEMLYDSIAADRAETERRKPVATPTTVPNEDY